MYGVDLVDFFRGRHSWRKLANLIRRLPVSSAFVEAQADDPEYAEWVAAQEEQPAGPPRLSEWTPERAELVDIKDRLAEVVAAVMWSASGKYREPRMSPRPRTAIDVARARQRASKYDSLVADVMAAQERWEATHGSGD